MPKKTSAAVAVRKNEKESNDLIAVAIREKAPVETMERLFALREKVKAEAAREAFVEAMSQFQKACPIIKKTKKVMNKDGVTVRYTFAPIDSIVEQIKTPLGDALLSYRWETKQEGKDITAICLVTHVLGHSEISEFTVSIDSEGYMTAPQKAASALTFAKRYSLCNALGISTGDEDTDAVDVNKEKEAKSIKSKIMFRLRTLGKPTNTQDEIASAVKELTTLDLKEENFNEIAGRLQVIIEEKDEDNKVR